MMKHYIIITLISVLTSFVSIAQQVVVEEHPEKLSERINTSAEELLPVLSVRGNRLYFVRSFHNDNVGGQYTGQDIWLSEKDRSGNWQEAVNLKELNSELNNAIIGTNQNGNTLFLLNSYTSTAREAYGIAYTNLKRGKQIAGSRLGMEILGNRKWTRPQEFPLAMQIQGDVRAYYISPDQDVVIYSTESTYSQGKEDLQLYYKEQNTWRGPVLLGENINSPGTEISPFLTQDKKTLFFASNGREGLGDFDIYMSERLDESSWEKWSPATNVGAPINTKGFDAYFATYPSGDSYFVSDRDGSSLDLYEAKVNITYDSLPAADTPDSLSINTRNILSDMEPTADRLDETIQADASSLVALASYAFFENLLLNLTVSHSKLNAYLSGMNSTDRILNKNTLLSVTGDADTELLAKLRDASLSHQVEINKKMTESNALAGDLAARAKLVQLKMDFRDSLQSLEMIDLLAVNAYLKKDISSLIDKNAHIKLQLQDTQPTQSLILKLDENNRMLQSICDTWEKNLKEIDQKIQKALQENELLTRIERSLAFAESINKQMKVYLNGNSEISANPDSLNQRLVHVNKNNVNLIQNLKQRFFGKNQDLDMLTFENSQYVLVIRQGAFTDQQVNESGVFYPNPEMDMPLDPRQEILWLIAQNAAAYMKLNTLGGDNSLKAISEIENNNLKLAEKMAEWGAKLQEFMLASNKVIQEKRTILITPSEITDQMEVQGYTIQIVAMNEGVPPTKSHLEKFRGEVIKMSRGLDGLDRYYIRQYDSKRQAMREVRKLRASSGFGDLFVRAIAKYKEL